MKKSYSHKFKNYYDMKKYILKIDKNYISGDKIQMGVPQMNDKLENAKIFTYDEALNKLNMICFDAHMIEI